MAFLATWSLSLAKERIILWISADSTHSVYSVPGVTSMSVLAASTLAGLCPRPSRLSPPGFVHTSSFCDCSPRRACSLPSCRVTGRIFLVGWVLHAARSLNTYLRFLLFTSETAGRKLSSSNTTPTGTDQSMPLKALPCVLNGF